MPMPNFIRLLAAGALVTCYAGAAVASDNCRPRAGAQAGTLAGGPPCPPPAAKAKPEGQKKPAEPNAFWSGVHIGGSVSTTTTIGR
jgi:hypothetical protein